MCLLRSYGLTQVESQGSRAFGVERWSEFWSWDLESPYITLQNPKISLHDPIEP